MFPLSAVNLLFKSHVRYFVLKNQTYSVLLSFLVVISSFHYSRAISSLLNARCKEWRRVPVSYKDLSNFAILSVATNIPTSEFPAVGQGLT